MPRDGWPYPPRMMLKLWLCAFCLRLTPTRRLEQRVREDLGLRYLAGGLMDEVEKQCRQRRAKVTAAAGFLSGAGLHECCRRGIDVYVPDPNLTHEINTGEAAGGLDAPPSTIRNICGCERSCAARRDGRCTNDGKR